MNNLEPDQVYEIWNSVPALSLRERILRFYYTLVPPHTSHPLDVLDLPTPLYRLLLRGGITTVEELREIPLSKLLTIRGLGPTKAATIRKALEAFIA